MDEPIAPGTLCQLHGKTGYKTRRQALDALSYLSERADYLKTRAVSQGKAAPTITGPSRAYHDPVCHWWHLTSRKR
jgi:hypothetical protein